MDELIAENRLVSAPLNLTEADIIILDALRPDSFAPCYLGDVVGRCRPIAHSSQRRLGANIEIARTQF